MPAGLPGPDTAHAEADCDHHLLDLHYHCLSHRVGEGGPGGGAFCFVLSLLHQRWLICHLFLEGGNSRLKRNQKEREGNQRLSLPALTGLPPLLFVEAKQDVPAGDSDRGPHQARQTYPSMIESELHSESHLPQGLLEKPQEGMRKTRVRHLAWGSKHLNGLLAHAYS